MVKLPQPGDVPPVTFKNFVTELASTALVCLGHITHPMSGRRQTDIPRASHVIGLLAMVAEKTEGNLDGDEEAYLVTVLQDLKEKLESAQHQQN